MNAMYQYYRKEVITLEQLGIMLYGYEKQHSDMILETLHDALDDEFFLVSGAEKEEMTLIEILTEGPDDIFKENENKILAFLGFDN